jgi:hypothetical protein
MKGLLEGVDGVVCGSALVCCNQNIVTLKQLSLLWRNANLLHIVSKNDRGKITLNHFTQPQIAWRT